MLHYAVVFLVIALIAALFGFTGIAVSAAEIRQDSLRRLPDLRRDHLRGGLAETLIESMQRNRF